MYRDPKWWVCIGATRAKYSVRMMNLTDKNNCYEDRTQNETEACIHIQLNYLSIAVAENTHQNHVHKHVTKT